jgi:hypothetical protein
MRRLSTSELNPAGYAKPEELDADRAIKERALVERFFNKIKQCRWIATNYLACELNWRRNNSPCIGRPLLKPPPQQKYDRGVIRRDTVRHMVET